MDGDSRTAPSVSVVIPARNEERYITAALKSVVTQTWPLDDMEIVVVDNGSTDATDMTVQTFMTMAAAPVVTIVHEPVPGVSRAKNRGAWAARGDLLIFLDADSWMHRQLVACVIDRARAGYPAGSIRVVADSADLIDRGFFGLIEFGKRLFGLRAQMFYCAREPFLRLHGFDESLTLAEDQEFLARLARAEIPVCQLNESWIATSPRRLHRLPLRLGMAFMLLRWALANWGIGRDWPY